MDKKLIGLITLFFISFVIFTSILVFQKPLGSLARASEELVPSATNSKIVLGCGSSILKADGKDTCIIYVFVRGGGQTPKPLANKLVTVSTNVGTFVQTSQTSDNLGKTSFIISSQTLGVATIKVTVSNDPSPVELAQTISLEFK